MRALFALFAFAAVGAALVVVGARRVVTSALALVVCFLAVAGLFILQGAEFLGAVQILLYAGSIVVMFVFVVMMLARAREENDWRGPRAAGAVALGVLVFGHLLAVLLRSGQWLSAPSAGLRPGEGHVQVLGKLLYREYLLPFEVLSLVLLAALFGVLVLGRRK